MILIDHEYHIVELEYTSNDTLNWCLEMFGNPKSTRWFNRGNKVYFADSKDHMMFLLKWS